MIDQRKEIEHMKTIGIGIQDFAKIADKNMFYIDKTAFLKEWWENQDSVTLITRPRRFGKTLLMSMTDYFFSVNHSDCKKYFEGLDIWKEEKFRELQGTYPVIFMSFADIKGSTYEKTRMGIIHKITKLYTDFEFLKRTGVLSGRDLEFYDSVSVDMGDDVAGIAIQYMCDYLRRYYGKNALVLLDEYDTPLQEAYVNDYWKELADFIRSLFNSTFKTNPYLERGLLTGITRVSKESIFSDLNNLEVVTTTSEKYSTSFGFTEKEVEKLCKQYGMDMEEVKNWYDGYSFDGVPSVYSPRSVVNSMRFQKISNYWNQTETFEALQVYIDMNFEHLKDDVLSMIAGESVAVNTESFTNDMETFRTEDDVLTLLIHLGYLAYDDKTKTVKIPNSEIRAEYVNTVSVSDWGSVSKALKDSADTLNAIWQGREEQVSKAIEQAHFETSHIQYNDENALSYTISLALYAARNFYTIHRELAGGKGFADLVFIPKKQFAEKPALVVELKWDKSAEGAIKQIKDKKYFESLEEYQDNLLLIGINYDKKTKEHVCKIEKY